MIIFVISSINDKQFQKSKFWVNNCLTLRKLAQVVAFVACMVCPKFFESWIGVVLVRTQLKMSSIKRVVGKGCWTFQSAGDGREVLQCGVLFADCSRVDTWRFSSNLRLIKPFELIFWKTIIVVQSVLVCLFCQYPTVSRLSWSKRKPVQYSIISNSCLIPIPSPDRHKQIRVWRRFWQKMLENNCNFIVLRSSSLFHTLLQSWYHSTLSSFPSDGLKKLTAL